MKKQITRLCKDRSKIKVIKKNNVLGVWIILINGVPYAVDAKHFKDYYTNET